MHELKTSGLSELRPIRKGCLCLVAVTALGVSTRGMIEQAFDNGICSSIGDAIYRGEVY